MDVLNYKFLTKLNSSELKPSPNAEKGKEKSEVLDKKELALALGIMRRPLQNLATVLNRINYKKIMENEKLAKLGDDEALRLLGDYYCNGIYGKSDPQKALECYLESVKKGNEKAAESIKRMLI